MGKTLTEEKQRSKGLDDDLRNLQQEYDKLASEKKTEVSALLAEKQFVWNQYNLLEKDYTDKLKSKQSEVEQANEKVQSLLASMEQLQSSNKEKDDKVALLTTEAANKETDSTKLKKENSKLLKELELLRKSASSSATSVLNHCSAGTRTYNLRGKNSSLDRSNVAVKKESSAAQLPDPLKDIKKVLLLFNRILFISLCKFVASVIYLLGGFDSVVNLKAGFYLDCGRKNLSLKLLYMNYHLLHLFINVLKLIGFV